MFIQKTKNFFNQPRQNLKLTLLSSQKEKQMKNFIKTLSTKLDSFFNGLAQARTAAALARMGEYEKAKNLYK